MAGSKKEGVKVDLFGQLSLPVGGQNYMMRPSFDAINAVESKLRALFLLANDAANEQLTLGEMGIICAEFMRAYGVSHPTDPLARDYTGANPEKLSRLIYEAGAPIVCARLAVILLGALTGGYDASGEVKATTFQKAIHAVA